MDNTCDICNCAFTDEIMINVFETNTKDKINVCFHCELEESEISDDEEQKVIEHKSKKYFMGV